MHIHAVLISASRRHTILSNRGLNLEENQSKSQRNMCTAADQIGCRTPSRTCMPRLQGIGSGLNLPTHVSIFAFLCRRAACLSTTTQNVPRTVHVDCCTLSVQDSLLKRSDCFNILTVAFAYSIFHARAPASVAAVERGLSALLSDHKPHRIPLARGSVQLGRNIGVAPKKPVACCIVDLALGYSSAARRRQQCNHQSIYQHTA
jgi:hypothetical protein